jgi:hypothetical protein
MLTRDYIEFWQAVFLICGGIFTLGGWMLCFAPENHEGCGFSGKGFGYCLHVIGWAACILGVLLIILCLMSHNRHGIQKGNGYDNGDSSIYKPITDPDCPWAFVPIWTAIWWTVIWAHLWFFTLAKLEVEREFMGSQQEVAGPAGAAVGYVGGYDVGGGIASLYGANAQVTANEGEGHENMISGKDPRVN